jgi:hypothetical protein
MLLSTVGEFFRPTKPLRWHVHCLRATPHSAASHSSNPSLIRSTHESDFKAPSLTTIADPHKALYAYHPNARRYGNAHRLIVSCREESLSCGVALGRSMLPIVFPHEAKKYVRYCHERNVSQITIGDPNKPSEKVLPATTAPTLTLTP